MIALPAGTSRAIPITATLSAAEEKRTTAPRALITRTNTPRAMRPVLRRDLPGTFGAALCRIGGATGAPARGAVPLCGAVRVAGAAMLISLLGR